MVDRFRPSSEFVAAAELLDTSNLATSTSTETETPNTSMPQSMSIGARVIMRVVEMVLPDTAMKMLTEWMHSTNGAFRGMA